MKTRSKRPASEPKSPVPKHRKAKRVMDGAPCIDPSKLYLMPELGPEEKLAMDLARQFQREEDPDYGSISYANQVKGCEAVNKLGFVKALDLLKVETEG